MLKNLNNSADMKDVHSTYLALKTECCVRGFLSTLVGSLVIITRNILKYTGNNPFYKL